MVTIQNWVTADEVIAVLNVEPPSPASYARFLQKYSDFVSADTASGTKAFLREWVANQEVGNSDVGFRRNYLAKAPYLGSPFLPPGQRWSLPDSISRKESQEVGAALVSAHLR